MATSDADRATGRPDRPTATLAGLLVALCGLPVLSVATAHLGEQSQVVAVVVQWVLLAAVLVITVRWEDRSLRSIGLRRLAPIDVGYLLVATVLGFLALAATGPLVEALGLSEANQVGLGVAAVGVELALLSAVTIGIVEEVLYRGYAIERLEEYTGSMVVAAGVSWAVFTVVHAPNWATSCRSPSLRSCSPACISAVDHWCPSSGRTSESGSSGYSAPSTANRAPIWSYNGHCRGGAESARTTVHRWRY